MAASRPFPHSQRSRRGTGAGPTQPVTTAPQPATCRCRRALTSRHPARPTSRPVSDRTPQPPPPWLRPTAQRAPRRTARRRPPAPHRAPTARGPAPNAANVSTNPAPSCDASGSFPIYTIQPGDTLSGVAVKFGLGNGDVPGWKLIVDSNKPDLVDEDDLLQIDQKLLIPIKGCSNPSPAPSAASTTSSST